jgi:hypothetical protein
MKFHLVYRVFESEQQPLDSFATSVATSILLCFGSKYAKLSAIIAWVKIPIRGGIEPDIPFYTPVHTDNLAACSIVSIH